MEEKTYRDDLKIETGVRRPKRCRNKQNWCWNSEQTATVFRQALFLSRTLKIADEQCLLEYEQAYIGRRKGWKSTPNMPLRHVVLRGKLLL